MAYKHRRPARPNTDQPMTPSTERRPDMTAFHTTYEQLASRLPPSFRTADPYRIFTRKDGIT